MAWMPRFAPLVFLAFLAACFALGVLGILIVYGLARGKRGLVETGLRVALGGAGLYAGLLLIASAASRPPSQQQRSPQEVFQAVSVARATLRRGRGPGQRLCAARAWPWA